jgi:hypothetical protein
MHFDRQPNQTQRAMIGALIHRNHPTSDFLSELRQLNIQKLEPIHFCEN